MTLFTPKILANYAQDYPEQAKKLDKTYTNIIVPVITKKSDSDFDDFKSKFKASYHHRTDQMTVNEVFNYLNNDMKITQGKMNDALTEEKQKGNGNKAIHPFFTNALTSTAFKQANFLTSVNSKQGTEVYSQKVLLRNPILYTNNREEFYIACDTEEERVIEQASKSFSNGIFYGGNNFYDPNREFIKEKDHNKEYYDKHFIDYTEQKTDTQSANSLVKSGLITDTDTVLDVASVPYAGFARTLDSKGIDVTALNNDTEISSNQWDSLKKESLSKHLEQDGYHRYDVSYIKAFDAIDPSLHSEYIKEIAQSVKKNTGRAIICFSHDDIFLSDDVKNTLEKSFKNVSLREAHLIDKETFDEEGRVGGHALFFVATKTKENMKQKLTSEEEHAIAVNLAREKERADNAAKELLAELDANEEKASAAATKKKAKKAKKKQETQSINPNVTKKAPAPVTPLMSIQKKSINNNISSQQKNINKNTHSQPLFVPIQSATETAEPLLENTGKKPKKEPQYLLGNINNKINKHLKTILKEIPLEKHESILEAFKQSIENQTFSTKNVIEFIGRTLGQETKQSTSIDEYVLNILDNAQHIPSKLVDMITEQHNKQTNEENPLNLKEISERFSIIGQAFKQQISKIVPLSSDNSFKEIVLRSNEFSDKPLKEFFDNKQRNQETSYFDDKNWAYLKTLMTDR